MQQILSAEFMTYTEHPFIFVVQLNQTMVPRNNLGLACLR